MALTEKILPDLVIVGPEAPLVAGIADSLRDKGFPVFGPGASGARLEGSKAFAKRFMERHGIPTAPFDVCENISEAERALEKRTPPFIVKANGLAAGKGVFILDSLQEAKETCFSLLEKMALGEAGRKIVIEDHLPGKELTILAVTDGKTWRLLPSSQDHKRAFDGDQGPNTGGMGAFSPVPWADTGFLERIEELVLEPTVRGLASDSIPYRGVLYCGLMIGETGEARVLEYNVRMGDPETQTVLPSFGGDFAEMALACARGDLSGVNMSPPSCFSVGVVMASAGYPGDYSKGFTISGLENTSGREGVTVFHSGTAINPAGRTITSGGRVLTVVGTGDDIISARRRAYDALENIEFEGAFFRKDIAINKE
jgi:phosphoribosylamine--glycine ligase